MLLSLNGSLTLKQHAHTYTHARTHAHARTHTSAVAAGLRGCVPLKNICAP